MTSAHRLRIELPDRPGALALAASIIGASGANVVSVDIHELEGDSAVDEILVEAPDGWRAADLAPGLEANGVTLLSSTPVRAPRDPVVTAMQWAGAIVAAGPAESDLELGRCILELTAASAAWVCDVPQAMSYEAGRLALERCAPVVQRTAAPDDGRGLPDTVWLLAVPDADLMPEMVAFAARPVALRFTASEIARVEALLALRRQLTPALRSF